MFRECKLPVNLNKTRKARFVETDFDVGLTNSNLQIKNSSFYNLKLLQAVQSGRLVGGCESVLVGYQDVVTLIDIGLGVNGP